MRIISNKEFKCEPASVQELETSPCLERNFRKSFWGYGYSHFSYMKRGVTMITNLDTKYSNNIFKSKDEIDLSKLEYWTILDNPICAKINLDNSIVPGMLMTITYDGNNAPLVFFPLALFCAWSEKPSSPLYDENYIDMYHLHGHKYLWKERPFTKIFSLFKKGTKIAFSKVSYRLSEYEPLNTSYYIHVW